jgi:hypothetical protein
LIMPIESGELISNSHKRCLFQSLHARSFQLSARREGAVEKCCDRISSPRGTQLPPDIRPLIKARIWSR